MLARLSDFKPDAASVTPRNMQLANKLSSGITSGDWRELTHSFCRSDYYEFVAESRR